MECTLKYNVCYCSYFYAELNDFMALLDVRLTQKEPHPVGLVAKKVRKVGLPSKSPPPINAPAWSIDPKYNNGECMITHFLPTLVYHTVTGVMCCQHYAHQTARTLSVMLCSCSYLHNPC